MNKDQSIIIEKVSNGWIVRPHSGFHDVSQLNEIKVFQTFLAMLEFLDSHFSKPEKENNDNRE